MLIILQINVYINSFINAVKILKDRITVSLTFHLPHLCSYLIFFESFLTRHDIVKIIFSLIIKNKQNDMESHNVCCYLY